VSAATMAEIGKSTLNEMDRVYAVVAVSEQRRMQPENGSGESTSTGITSRPDASEGQSMLTSTK
jgi:hypothetical protein